MEAARSKILELLGPCECLAGERCCGRVRAELELMVLTENLGSLGR